MDATTFFPAFRTSFSRKRNVLPPIFCFVFGLHYLLIRLAALGNTKQKSVFVLLFHSFALTLPNKNQKDEKVTLTSAQPGGKLS